MGKRSAKTIHTTLGRGHVLRTREGRLTRFRPVGRGQALGLVDRRIVGANGFELVFGGLDELGAIAAEVLYPDNELPVREHEHRAFECLDDLADRETLIDVVVGFVGRLINDIFELGALARENLLVINKHYCGCHWHLRGGALVGSNVYQCGKALPRIWLEFGSSNLRDSREGKDNSQSRDDERPTVPPRRYARFRPRRS